MCCYILSRTQCDVFAVQHQNRFASPKGNTVIFKVTISCITDFTELFTLKNLNNLFLLNRYFHQLIFTSKPGAPRVSKSADGYLFFVVNAVVYSTLFLTSVLIYLASAVSFQVSVSVTVIDTFSLPNNR